MPNLPKEIIEDILSRLPVKSLRRFRCVCKPWNSLITSTRFINLHLNRITTDPHYENNQSLLVACESKFGSLDVSKTPENGVVVPTVLDCPLVEDAIIFNIYGSCNGLILLCAYNGLDTGREEYEPLFLLNPSTRESKKLPIMPFTGQPFPESHFCGISFYGFGHDSSLDDYKVLRIVFPRIFGTALHDPVVCVYALRTNSWRVIGTSPYKHRDSCDGISGTLLNGVIHWLDFPRSSYGSLVIASFDLSNETFRDLQPPSSIRYVKYVCNCLLGVLGGCLCIIWEQYDFCTDVWVMREYGVQESWTKFRMPELCSLLEPLCFLGQCIVSLQAVSEGEKIVVYDSEKETSRHMVVGVNALIFHMAAYVESLVSPNLSDEIEEPL